MDNVENNLSAKESLKVRRDPERTKAQILQAAKTEFARYGLGGARVDRITDHAGSNKRMLYYYFGSKEDLFLAVIENCYEEIRRAEQDLNLSHLEPVDGLTRLIDFTWNYYLEHPEFITLLNSENLHQARHLKKSKKVSAMHTPLLSSIGELLSRGQKMGIFRSGIDPVQLYISIAALAYFYLSNNYTLSNIFVRDLMSANAQAEWLSHITEVILGYLKK